MLDLFVKELSTNYLGTAFDFLFLAALAWAGGLAWLALGYFGLQVSSNLAHGPLQGLLPDQVPEDQLGRASGFKNFMDMAGLIISSLIVGRVLVPERPVPALALVATILAVSAAVTILGVRERPSVRVENEPERPFGEAFRIDLRIHRSFHRHFEQRPPRRLVGLFRAVRNGSGFDCSERRASG